MQCLYIYPSPFNRVSDNNIGPIKMVHCSLLLLFSVALYIHSCRSFLILCSYKDSKQRAIAVIGVHSCVAKEAFAIDEINRVEHLP